MSALVVYRRGFRQQSRVAARRFCRREDPCLPLGQRESSAAALQSATGAALLEGLQGLIPGRMPNLLAAFYGAGGTLAAASSEHGGRPCDRGRMPSIANGLRLILNCLVTVTFNHL